MNLIELIVLYTMALFWGALSFFAEKELISYVTVGGALSFAALALGLHRRRQWRVWRRRLFPKRIWRHPSARQDAIYYLLIQPTRLLLILPLLLWMFQLSSGELVEAMESLLGKRWAQAGAENAWWAYLLYTFCMFLALDFAFFFSHYLSHKSKLLWCFHKVHHSAPVLVPFTAMRFHPLDMMWNIGWAIGGGLVMSALCQYSFYNGEQQWQLLGNNVVVALSYLTTHNLRHSHIWLHYPRWLSNWLISPAQHQIHHSRAEAHWDKNFGYLFAGWDRLFGTLINPEQYERLRLGVNENGGLYQGHTTIRGMLLTPFAEAWEVVCTGRKTNRRPLHNSSFRARPKADEKS